MAAEQTTPLILLLFALAGLSFWFKEGQNWILGAAIGMMIFLLLVFGLFGMF